MGRGRNGERAMRTEPTAVLVVVAVLAVLATFNYGLLVHNVPGYIIRGLLAVIAIILFVWLVPQFHRNRLSRRPAKYPLKTLDDAHAYSLQIRAGNSGLTATQAKIFAQAVTQPNSVRQRIIDTYTPGRRAIEQRVSIGVRLPRELIQGLDDDTAIEDIPIYFPVIMPLKGKLQDGFDLYGADGDAGSVLGYREYLQLAASVLRLLLLSMVKANGQPTLTPAQRAVEKQALGQIMRRGRSYDKTPDVPAHFTSIGFTPTTAASLKIAQLLGNGQNKPEEALDACRLAISFVDKLTNHYCIVGSLSADRDGRMLVKYEQTIVPQLKLADDEATRWNRIGGWLRVALGARPVDLTISINNASTCRSYHLRVLAGDELYLGAQEAVDFDANMDVQVKGAPTTAYVRFRERLGQGYSHFYTRFFPEPADRTNPRIRFVFFEVPPGSLIRSVVTAVAAFALIWVVAGINSRNPSPDTDAPAFLLAFPAIAATWLGFESPSRRLLEGTLKSRLCLLITAATSLSAAALFLTHKSILPNSDSWVQLPWGISFLWVSDLSWVVLLFVALANAVAICYKYVVETWQFAFFATRAQDLSEVTQNG